MKNNDRVTCIIPARYASKRLPGKPLLFVNDLPLVMWAYRSAEQSGAFDEIFIATDDETIYRTVIKFGGRAMITSKDHVSGTDRVMEAVDRLGCSFIVNLQGDEPMLPLHVIQAVSRKVKKLDANSILTVVSNVTYKKLQDPNVVKAVLSVNNNALYFSRAPIPYIRGRLRNAYSHTGIYGYSMESLKRFCSLPHGKLEEVEKLEQLRALEHEMKIKCLVMNFDNIGIDTPEDLENFKQKVKNESN